ncbi:MAG TPA: hypothetical protein VHG93_18760 [Longimicrobium sp.]|nr:hypothetical protein [Longimicrobium sp.]
MLALPLVRQARAELTQAAAVQRQLADTLAQGGRPRLESGELPGASGFTPTRPHPQHWFTNRRMAGPSMASCS